MDAKVVAVHNADDAEEDDLQGMTKFCTGKQVAVTEYSVQARKKTCEYAYELKHVPCSLLRFRG